MIPRIEVCVIRLHETRWSNSLLPQPADGLPAYVDEQIRQRAQERNVQQQIRKRQWARYCVRWQHDYFLILWYSRIRKYANTTMIAMLMTPSQSVTLIGFSFHLLATESSQSEDSSYTYRYGSSLGASRSIPLCSLPPQSRSSACL